MIETLLLYEPSLVDLSRDGRDHWHLRHLMKVVLHAENQYAPKIAQVQMILTSLEIANVSDATSQQLLEQKLLEFSENTGHDNTHMHRVGTCIPIFIGFYVQIFFSQNYVRVSQLSIWTGPPH